jgi:hypothetical protein
MHGSRSRMSRLFALASERHLFPSGYFISERMWPSTGPGMV